MKARLYRTHIAHRRLSPRQHSLHARAAYLLIDVEQPPRGLRLLGINRRGLFSFHQKDHGTGQDLAATVRARASRSGADCSGPVLLFALPRLFGFVFNPVSVFVCHDAQGRPSASLFEVNNFHGERHFYVNRLDPGTKRHTHTARKEFHVSPFLALDHDYRFVFELSDTAVHFAITEAGQDGAILYARLSGHGEPLTDTALFKAALSYPFQTIRIFGAILFEASKLWIKRIPVVPHPGERHRDFTIARKY